MVWTIETANSAFSTAYMAPESPLRFGWSPSILGSTMSGEPEVAQGQTEKQPVFTIMIKIINYAMKTKTTLW